MNVFNSLCLKTNVNIKNRLFLSFDFCHCSCCFFVYLFCCCFFIYRFVIDRIRFNLMYILFIMSNSQSVQVSCVAYRTCCQVLACSLTFFILLSSFFFFLLLFYVLSTKLSGLICGLSFFLLFLFLFIFFLL